MVMGHEGNFGVVTEAVVRIRPAPAVKEFSSIVFYNFDIGVKFMEDVARNGVWPASIRLVDNT
jgi:alkyldihydroxyacetonephosphate synthase